jgi:hypothetical protein
VDHRQVKVLTAPATLLALAILASFLAYLAIEIGRSDARFARWGRAPGVIERSAIGKEFVHTSSRSASPRLQEVWVADLRYRYVVGGKVHAGTRLSNETSRKPVAAGGPPESLRRSLAELPPGRNVTVRFSPENPDASYLRIETGGWKPFAAGSGALFLLIAVLAVLRFTRG